VIVRPVAWHRLGWEGPPVPAWTADVFHVFGVFWTFERVNRDVAIEGRRAETDDWIRLRAEELVPVSRAERMSRLWAGRRVGDFPQRTREETLALQARRLRARWNRTHPRERISAVRIVEETWPRSHEGYEARRAGNVRRRIWHEE
jgi:hypothetical protein